MDPASGLPGLLQINIVVGIMPEERPEKSPEEQSAQEEHPSAQHPCTHDSTFFLVVSRS